MAAFEREFMRRSPSEIAEPPPRHLVLLIMPGGAWVLARLNRLRRSAAGRFARRHPEHAFAAGIVLPLTVAIGAAIESAGLIPGAHFNAVDPLVAGLAAAAIQVSPTLQSLAFDALRLLRSVAASALIIIGLAASALVVLWPSLQVTPSLTLTEAALDLRTLQPGLAGLFFGCWAAVFIACRLVFGLPLPMVRKEPASMRRRSAARHEASHALVAVVLGHPAIGARILLRSWSNGIGGEFVMDAPDPASGRDIHALLVREIAMLVAGVAGDLHRRPIDEVYEELRGQTDWARAPGLSWLAAALWPDRALCETVTELMVPALARLEWQAAIACAADELVLAADEWVPAETFAAISGRYALSLPEIESLACGGWVPDVA